MALSGSIKVALGLTESKASDLGAGSFPITKEYSWKVASGTGTGQADLVFSDQRSLAAAANEDLDVSGVLVTMFGPTLALLKFKGLIIKAADSNPANLTLSRPAANGVPIFAAVSDAIVLPPGAVFAWFAPVGAGITIAAGTADLLNMLAGAGGTHTYDIVILGCSA